MTKNYIGTFIANNIDILLKFLVSMFLARKLLPEDFGLMAITIAIVSILKSIVQLGFGSAIIQFNGPRLKERFSTIFWFNIVISILMFTSLNFLAPFISSVFQTIVLENIVKVVSVIIIFEALILVQRSYLVKTLKFKLINQRLIISGFISGIIGCLMAYNDFGVWSLVAMSISSSLISLILYWYYSDWTPNFSFDYEHLKPLLNFGIFHFFEILVKNIFKRINTFFIGKFFDINLLGFYNKANSFSDKFLNNSLNSFNKVVYPHLSKNQENDKKFYLIYNTSYSLVAFLVFSLSGIFLLWSHEIINIVYGPNWSKSSEILQVLVLAGFVRPLLNINSSLFLSKGFSLKSFKISLINRLISVFTLIIGILYGFNFFIYAFVSGEIAYFFINFLYIKTKLKNKIIIRILKLTMINLFLTLCLFVIKLNFLLSIDLKLLISTLHLTFIFFFLRTYNYESIKFIMNLIKFDLKYLKF